MDCDPDIIGWNELGKNWRHLPEEMQLRQTTKQWWAHCSTACAHLHDTENRGERQIGGVAMVVLPSVTGHIIQRGQDNRKMGRWTWYSFRGEESVITTVITIYRPCNTDPRLLGSAKSQQLMRFREKYPQIVCDPLEQFDQDLRVLIESNTNKGHQVVVMGDFNQDLMQRSSPTRRMMESVGLVDGKS